MEANSISFGIAFLAGLVSFLSPCVLPVVPSYVSFVTGLTLDDLQRQGISQARKQAALHAALFVLGFSLVFIALGASATALGSTLRRALPLLQQIGGIIVFLFGLYLLGVIKLRALTRERRVQLASKPAGKLGSVAVGIAFGAGWTPCVGPVLASILLYAGLQATMVKGMVLLGFYAIGLGIPFFAAAVGLNWFLSRTRSLRPHLHRIERAAGVLLLVIGVLLFTGRFAALANFFAGFGQVINLEI